MWPFDPKKQDIDAAINSAKKDMDEEEPDALDVLEDLDLGTLVFGNLLYCENGFFIDPADISVMDLHPSLPQITLRNGTKINLTKSGALSVAEVIKKSMKGRSL